MDDPLKSAQLDWWIGFTLLLAIGTLTYIALMHILPTVYSENGDELDEYDLPHDEEETTTLLPPGQNQDEENDPKRELLVEKEAQVKEANRPDTRGERVCKLVTLLAGLYAAELLRFI